MKTSLKFHTCVLAAIFMLGCTRVPSEGKSVEETAAKTETTVEPAALPATMPANPPLQPGDYSPSFNVAGVPPFVREAKTWDELTRSLPAKDANYLREVNHNYFGAIAFHSAQERHYLESAGFPMPEEWLAARHMGDEQPKALSDAGNMKARAIYLDRLMARASEYLPLRDSDDTTYRNSPGHSYSMSAYELSGQLQHSYKSPFAAYVLGAMYSKLNYPPSPEPAAAGIFSAFDAGDKRAVDILNRYASAHPDMNIGKIMVARSATRVAK